MKNKQPSHLADRITAPCPTGTQYYYQLGALRQTQGGRSVQCGWVNRSVVSVVSFMEQPDASLCSWCFGPRGEIAITTISLCKKKKKASSSGHKLSCIARGRQKHGGTSVTPSLVNLLHRCLSIRMFFFLDLDAVPGRHFVYLMPNLTKNTKIQCHSSRSPRCQELLFWILEIKFKRWFILFDIGHGHVSEFGSQSNSGCSQDGPKVSSFLFLGKCL